MRGTVFVLVALITVLHVQATPFAEDGALLAEQTARQSIGNFGRCLVSTARNTVDDVSAILSRCAEEIGEWTPCVRLGVIELVQDVVVAIVKCLRV